MKNRPGRQEGTLHQGTACKVDHLTKLLLRIFSTCKWLPFSLMFSGALLASTVRHISVGGTALESCKRKITTENPRSLTPVKGRESLLMIHRAA